MDNPIVDAVADILLAYNPSEPRDSKGRWTDALDRAIAGDTADLEALVAADHGPSRITMPQLSGVPAPGSKAARKFKPAPGQEVDLTDEFMKELQRSGVSVQTEQVKISDLKPTQDELVGSTVAGLSKFMMHAPADSPVWEPIFVSADDHVIDGHHRWAARTVRAKIDGTPDETMAVRKIGLSIDDALPVAVQFMKEWGLPVAGMSNRAVVSNFAPAKSATMSLSTPIVSVQDGPRMTTAHFGDKKAAPFRKGGKRRKAMLAKDALRKRSADLANVSHEPRDRKGRWTASAGYVQGSEMKKLVMRYKRYKAKRVNRAIAKEAANDYSNVDLAFNPREPRDRAGMWTRGHDALKLGGAKDARQLEYLAAKNDLATALLSGDHKSKKKAIKRLAKAKGPYLNFQASIGQGNR